MNILSPLARSAKAGEYSHASEEEIRATDCVFVMPFGFRIENRRKVAGPISENLGLLALSYGSTLRTPIIAPLEVGDVVASGSRGVYEGMIEQLWLPKESSTRAGVLATATKIMTSEGLSNPLLIAQAHDMSLVATQANRAEMAGVCAPYLPNEFDKASAQRRTRSLKHWMPCVLATIFWYNLE